MFRKILTAVLVTLIFFVTTGNRVALAETDDIFKVSYGDYKDKNVYYHLDYIDPTELEDDKWYDRFKVFENLKEGVVGFFYNLLHDIFVNFPFTLIKVFTTAMIWIFNKIYEVNFVDSIVEEITSSIQNIAGISGSNFSTTGLFGGFLGIVTVSIAIYALYQFIVKRASISAFSGLLKSLFSLVLALVFFSNYSTIISGLNTLSVEASSLIVSGSVSVNEQGNISNNTAQDEMNSALWDVFVHKPYLMLQYGTMDESAIGESRITKLLEQKPNTENRVELIKEEVIDNNNEMMTRGKIFERWVILGITAFGNMFNSIPIFILSFALIFFQFWFTAMAMIAPFVFIWSAFPNQFGVLARYLLELITPLVLKIAVSVLALIVFSLTGILANVAMNTMNTNGLLALIFLLFVEGILFFTLFLLRNRIANIFSAGSRQLSVIRENMSGTFTQPFKKGVQTVATTGGTVAGAMTGGTQGAITGANIGSTVGQVLTGDRGIAEAGRDIALATSLHESLKNRKNAFKNSDGEVDNNLNETTGATTPDDSNDESVNETEYAQLEENKGTNETINDTTTNESSDKNNNYDNLSDNLEPTNIETSQDTNTIDNSPDNPTDGSTDQNLVSLDEGNLTNTDSSNDISVNDISTNDISTNDIQTDGSTDQNLVSLDEGNLTNADSSNDIPVNDISTNDISTNDIQTDGSTDQNLVSLDEGNLTNTDSSNNIPTGSTDGFESLNEGNITNIDRSNVASDNPMSNESGFENLSSLEKNEKQSGLDFNFKGSSTTSNTHSQSPISESSLGNLNSTVHNLENNKTGISNVPEQIVLNQDTVSSNVNSNEVSNEVEVDDKFELDNYIDIQDLDNEANSK